MNVRSHAQKYLRKLLIGKRKVCTSEHRDYFKHILTVRKESRKKLTTAIEFIKANTKDPNLMKFTDRFKFIWEVESTKPKKEWVDEIIPEADDEELD